MIETHQMKISIKHQSMKNLPNIRKMMCIVIVVVVVVVVVVVSILR